VDAPEPKPLHKPSPAYLPAIGETEMSDDFSNILHQPMSSLEKPKPLPAGIYAGVYSGYKFDKTAKDEPTPFVQLQFLVLAPVEVDEEALAQAGGMPEKGLNVRKDFYLTDKAAFRLREALEALGADSTSTTAGEALEALKGGPALLLLKQESKRGEPETIYTILDKILPNN
jgi:hypothetical protein